jgi:hypothetical protein
MPKNRHGGNLGSATAPRYDRDGDILNWDPIKTSFFS